MKPTHHILFTLLLLCGVVQAQFNRQDPLGGTRTLIKQHEFVLFYGQTSNASSSVHETGSFTYQAIGSNLVQTTSNTGSAGLSGAYGIPVTEIAGGSFFGPEFSDGILYAYRSRSGNTDVAAYRLEVQRRFNAGNGFNATPLQASLGNIQTSNQGNLTPRVVAASGFFGDPDREEAIIAWHDANGRIMINRLRFDITPTSPGSNSFSLSASVLDNLQGPLFDTDNKRVPSGLSATAVDLDLDGRDELALAYEKNDDLFVEIYGVDSLGVLGLRSSQKVLDMGVNPCTGQAQSYNFSDLSIKLSAGDLNFAFAGEEIVLAAHYGLQSGIGSAGSNQGLYVIPIRRDHTTGNLTFMAACTDPGAASFATGAAFTSTDNHFRDQPTSLDVAVGDLDGDLDLEIVVGVGSSIRCLNVTKGESGSVNYLQMNQLASISVAETSNSNANNGGEGEYANRWLAVGNIDNLNTGAAHDFRAEIFVGKNINFVSDPSSGDIQQSFRLQVWGFQTSGAQGAIDFNNPLLRAELNNIASQNANNNLRHFSVAMLDLDGGSVRLGTPTRTERSDVLTPLVVLNAPPTHFDLIGSQSYDVCNLYGSDAPPANISHFNSVYEQITTQEFSFETQFNSDWAVSAEVNAGFSMGGFDLGAKMSRTYGERFSQVQGSEFVRTITNQRTALLDDELLAYFVDYAVFEYPVFKDGETEAGTHIMVVVPRGVRDGFRGARSNSHRYLINHQHGNLFSYPTQQSELPIITGSQANLTSFPFREISKTSGFEDLFAITQDQATSAGVESEQFTSTTVGANAGGAFKGFGLSVSVEGTYEESEVQTRTNRYRDQVTLKGFFGQGETSTIPGDYPYEVTPVVYWDASGALVLDYFVDIDKSGFWASLYDTYDPAFLLLDPLKPEKGLEDPATFNNAARYQTRDILFDRLPAPGKETTIRARVHNYGFKGTPAQTPIRVNFYSLDPAGSDTLEFIGADSVVVGMLGREDGFDTEFVEVDWTIPAGLGPNTKVVAIIDEANVLSAEVHDYPQGNGISNNVGWTCLFGQDCTLPTSASVFFPDGTTSIGRPVESMKLRLGPNPATETAWLYLPGEWQGALRMEAVNQMGQVVYQQALMKAPGEQTYRIDCASWPAGVYHLRVSSRDRSGHVSLIKVE